MVSAIDNETKPALGDAVPLTGWDALIVHRTSERDQAREERDARQRDLARMSDDLGTLRATIGSIAVAVGMHVDAMPGAIVERVEALVRDCNAGAERYIAERDALGESIEAALGAACTGDLAADVAGLRAEVARLTERLRYYENGHYDRLVADLQARIDAAAGRPLASERSE